MTGYKPDPSVRAQYDLAGRVALVTGGGGFLGCQFADGLAEMGALPVLIDIPGEGLEKAVGRLREKWGTADGYAADVTEETELLTVRNRIMEQHRRIDILVNAAGLTKYGCDAEPERFFAPFEETDTEVWEAGIRTNLTGVMLCCKTFAGPMLARKKGAIVNIGSDVGIISPDQRIYEPEGDFPGVDFNVPAFYSASKAGVIHLTRHLATIWAPHNVRVNAFSPAGVYRDHDPAFVDRLVSRIPMGRMGAVDEYKGAIVFLASDASSFVTGHNLVMDGGRTIW